MKRNFAALVLASAVGVSAGVLPCMAQDKLYTAEDGISREAYLNVLSMPVRLAGGATSAVVAGPVFGLAVSGRRMADARNTGDAAKAIYEMPLDVFSACVNQGVVGIKKPFSAESFGLE